MNPLFVIAAAAAFSTPVQTSHFENVLGTSLELRIGASSPDAARRAEAAALAEIQRNARILSAYDPQSEFSRWAQTSGQPVHVSPELYELLGLFDQWRAQSGGALNASAETINRVWKQAAAQGRRPTPNELAAAAALAQKQHWRLDPATQTATRLTTAPLALNSFAKSYIVNKATDAAMRQHGVNQVLVNIGGDLVVRGPAPQQVAIADPFSDTENSPPVARLALASGAVATSGNYRRGVSIDGQWYSHIVDPRTALPASTIVSATVVAPNATDAGALATAFNVVSPDEAPRLAASRPGVEYMLIAATGARFQSPGWNSIALPLAAAAAPAPSFELLINLELARIEGQAYRRPFVAVWIEDADHLPVRTLALWFDKARWLPDLKQWYRGERLRSLADGGDLASTVSSATRPPGRYTLKWDGNDQKGAALKPGRYTVCIEAAREHGTYQVIRQELNLNGKPQQFTLAPNTEISSASLDYRKAVK